MPNATLCAKAVVEMLLSQTQSQAQTQDEQHISFLQDNLVAYGDLPNAYLITKERIHRCRNLDSVELQDWKAEVGLLPVQKKKEGGNCEMS